MKTTISAKAQTVKNDWIVVDLEGKTLGRAASVIASRLRGKHKPIFTPHVDTGDFVVVINAEKLHLTGDKWKKKRYYRYTGYPGGIRSLTAEEMRDKHPERIIYAAVKGMIPKNRLGAQIMKKLKVYVGPDHPHQAQQPKYMEL